MNIISVVHINIMLSFCSAFWNIYMPGWLFCSDQFCLRMFLFRMFWLRMGSDSEILWSPREYAYTGCQISSRQDFKPNRNTIDFKTNILSKVIKWDEFETHCLNFMSFFLKSYWIFLKVLSILLKLGILVERGI